MDSYYNKTAKITVRFAFPDDEPALWRLAALESAERPAEPLLLAEVDDEPLAALSLSDGQVVADPFRRTLDVVALLRARAAQLTGADSKPRRFDRLRTLARGGPAGARRPVSAR